MNCDHVRKKIKEALAHSGLPEGGGPVMEHIQHCELCRRFYEDAVLGHALSRMPEPDPGPDFAGKIISKAIRHARAKRKRSIAGMSAAAAAVVLFGILFTWHAPDRSGFNGTEVQNVAFQQEEVSEKTIRVVIEAAGDRQNATLIIELAENLVLKDHRSERRIEWQTNLVKGRNLLEFPVLIHDDAGGYVNVRCRYNGREHELRIPVPARPKRG